jgi:Tol biopolymer transport system component
MTGQPTRSVLAQPQKSEPTKIVFVGGDKHVYIVNYDGTHKQLLTPKNIPVTDVAWSPNGKEILFCSCIDSRYNDTARFYVMDVDSKGMTKLELAKTGIQPPAWSPNGQQIVFAALAASQENLFTINKDGTNKRLITHINGSIRQFSWSPNGQYIAFVVSESDQYHLYIVNMDDLTQSGPFATGIWGISWSPDSRTIAWSPIFNSGDGRVRILNIENHVERVVSNGEVDGGVVWLSNSQKLIFSWQIQGVLQLYSVNSDGTHLTNLTNNDQVSESFFDVSSDDSHLAFISNAGYGKRALFTSKIDGTERHQVIETGRDEDWPPKWSPDNQHIAFVTGDSTSHWYLNIIDPDGTNKKQIGIILLFDGEQFAWQPLKHDIP